MEDVTIINFDSAPMGEQSDWVFRVPADGEYVATSGHAALFAFLQAEIANLTDEQRLELFAPWCSYCGGPAPCQCWNDE